MKNDNLMKMNLQFFADEGAGGSAGAGSNDNAGGNDGSNSGNNEGSNNNGNQTPPDNDDGKAGASGKTFTQEELSAVAATEKKQGKQSILNLFGVKNEKEAKEQAEAFKKWQESQKDTEQKLKDSQTNLAEAQAKAKQAEDKLALMTAGVNKDSLDDALAIAALKVTDDKDLAAVLEEMKKDPKYKGFFGTSGSAGTGSSTGHQGTGAAGTENIGERLGKLSASHAAPKKSNFFTN